MQNYTFLGSGEVNDFPAYHFQANESNICCVPNSLLGSMGMNFFEDVWVDPITGTVLDQHYNVTLYGLNIGNKTVRDIDASFTDEQINASISTAKRQALAQYYQGNDVVALRLVGEYTEKEQSKQIASAKDNEAAKKLGTVTLPSILIGLAVICLAAGFYV